MLRITPRVLIGELRRKLAAAIARRDIAAIRGLRQQLTVARIQLGRRGQIAGMFRRALDRLKALLSGVTETTIGRFVQSATNVIAELERTVGTWFRETLHETATQIRTETRDDLWAVLTPAQRRAATELPFDRTGVMMPPAGDVPPDLTDDGMTAAEVWSRVAPLVWIAGDKAAEDERDPLLIAFPGFASPEAVERSVERSVPGVSAHWRTKLRLIWQDMYDAPRRITEALRRRVTIPDVGRLLDKLFDDVANLVGMELQHEALRIKGEAEDEVGQSLRNAVDVGYTLRSRFAPNTAPDHAARDGYRYFRDDRPGSAAPWANRIIPPYRKNCLCFTVPILQTPDGDLHNAEFGIRISGGQEIGIRDVGTWQTWFDAQRPWAQKKIVGEKRWFGAAGASGGKPRWVDFVDAKGRLMPARKLAMESDRARGQRTRRVQRLIDEATRRHREAWARAGVKLNTRQEAEYRRRLGAILRRLV